ncbi:PsbP-related protein [Methanobacterium petrolearium]|uniref:PsbP-related protein n=1 Tax=Methanobacterium petrolearium TaxID=710190 RepID=UPI001AE8228B|nr:PsbP-related protein [Methanobacterium petrolearium]MBP1945661.1 hypothetical protein [Methanobacterium petrolearium]
MSENGPPKLRRPGSDSEKKGSGKFKKTETNIKEAIDSLNIKKKKTDISNKVSSLKSKSKKDKKKKEGPLKLKIPGAKKEPETRSGALKKNAKYIMREKPLLGIIGLIILIIIIATAAMWAMDDKNIKNPSNNTSNQTNITKNHYSDGNISFDYPEGWDVTPNNITSSSQFNLIVTVSKDENNSLSIFKEELGTQNFTYSVASWRANVIQNGMIYYEGDLTVDNCTAYEFMANYKPEDKVYTIRGIAFQKNRTGYYLMFVFDNALLNYKTEMDKVINSFHVTESPIL